MVREEGIRKDTVREVQQINRRWRPALMAFFLRRVRNHAEAEDLTQEVFVRMLNSSESEGAPDAYVFQIAANLLTDQARRARVRAGYRETLAGMDGLGIEQVDPYRIAAGRDQLAALAAALNELPERQRTMFTLYRIENMSQEMIGEAFGISKSAVKQQVAKAMAFLMARMRETQ